MWYEPHGIILPQPAKGSLESRCKVPRILVFHVRRLVHVVRHSCAVDTEASHVYTKGWLVRSFVRFVCAQPRRVVETTSPSHSSVSRNPEPAQSAFEFRFDRLSLEISCQFVWLMDDSEGPSRVFGLQCRTLFLLSNASERIMRRLRKNIELGASISDKTIRTTKSSMLVWESKFCYFDGGSRSNAARRVFNCAKRSEHESRTGVHK